MYRTAGTAIIVCDYNKQQPYTVFCWCWPNVYSCMCNIMSTVNSTYCYIQCDIKTTNLRYTEHTLSQPTTTLYNIHLYWRAMESNFNCMLFITRWQPKFPLQLLTDQNNDCCLLHKSTTFVSPSRELKLFVPLLHWTNRYQQNLSCFN